MQLAALLGRGIHPQAPGIPEEIPAEIHQVQLLIGMEVLVLCRGASPVFYRVAGGVQGKGILSLRL